MTRCVSDAEVEAAFTAWARESLAGSTAESFSVTDAETRTEFPQRRRRMVPALAAAAVVLVSVAVSLAIRYVGQEKAAPTTHTTECPRQAPLAVAPLPSDGQPLFTRPVAEMTACSYTGFRAKSRLVAAVPLGHRLSAKLAQHLNHAATSSNDAEQCLILSPIAVLLARDAHGNPLAPVTLTPGCRHIAATNGSTTRYLDGADPAFRQANRYVNRHR